MRSRHSRGGGAQPRIISKCTWRALTCCDVERQDPRLYLLLYFSVELAEPRQARCAHPHDEVLVQDTLDRTHHLRVRLVQVLRLWRSEVREEEQVRGGGGAKVGREGGPARTNSSACFTRAAWGGGTYKTFLLLSFLIEPLAKNACGECGEMKQQVTPVGSGVGKRRRPKPRRPG